MLKVRLRQNISNIGVSVILIFDHVTEPFISVAGLPQKTVYAFDSENPTQNGQNGTTVNQNVHLCEVPETHVIDTSTTIGRKMIKRRKNKVKIISIRVSF